MRTLIRIRIRINAWIMMLVAVQAFKDPRPKKNAPIQQFHQWLREEWHLHRRPDIDPCMDLYHERYRTNASTCKGITDVAMDGCHPLWAHRLAVQVNECGEERHPPKKTCRSKTLNRTCWGDEWHACYLKGGSAGFCTALLSNEYRLFDVQDCEKTWVDAGNSLVEVEEDCVQWIAAFGCDTGCSCVAVTHKHNTTYVTEPCPSLPHEWPSIGWIDTVLLLGVWVYLFNRRSGSEL